MLVFDNSNNYHSNLELLFNNPTANFKVDENNNLSLIKGYNLWDRFWKWISDFTDESITERVNQVVIGTLTYALNQAKLHQPIYVEYVEQSCCPCNRSCGMSDYYPLSEVAKRLITAGQFADSPGIVLLLNEILNTADELYPKGNDSFSGIGSHPTAQYKWSDTGWLKKTDHNISVTTWNKA